MFKLIKLILKTIFQAFFAIIVGSIALALQQTRINDLQYQINRISTTAGSTFYDNGNTATTAAFQSRIDSLESMVSTLQTQSTTATSNINSLSADQTSICTQVNKVTTANGSFIQIILNIEKNQEIINATIFSFLAKICVGNLICWSY